MLNTKGIYYREIGEAPKLRAIHNIAKQSRAKQHLDLSCEYLAKCLSNPAYVANYELKLKGVR